MMNQVKMYSKYTETFLNTLECYPDLLDDMQLDTKAHTDKFIDMLIARWGIYEIGGETIRLFQLYLNNTFNTYKDYYIEMINAYETKIEWTDGIKTEITETINDNSANKETTIDLPNKIASVEYPSSKVNNEGVSDKARSYIEKGGINIVELKKDYLSIIRNIYAEFVSKFNECFIALYD